jgi:antitoxin (DNA-binding transcriptional repressor) of toxin-antitoxin stability system
MRSLRETVDIRRVIANRSEPVARLVPARPPAEAASDACSGRGILEWLERHPLPDYARRYGIGSGDRGAMRILYTDTHNRAEGAGAAAFAAAWQDRARLKGKRVAVVLSGGNIDRKLFAHILAEEDADR